MTKTASVIGFDSETNQGPPITIQFYSEDVPHITGILWVNRDNVTEVTLKYLRRLKKGYYRIYGHNLVFDLISLLWQHLSMLADGDISQTLYGWTVQGRYGHPSFLVLSRDGVMIEMVDAMLWFSSTLERAGEIVCPDLPKLKRPKDLGTKNYKKTDDEFVEYAMRDAVISYHQGKAIEKYHEVQEIPQSLSLASMAARIFQQRHQRLTIYQPPSHDWMLGALASYHGGVNRTKPGASPAWHRDVYGWDFSSAYPAAMHTFPAFSNAANYRKLNTRGNHNRVRDEMSLGVFKISGTARNCHYPVIFDHQFKPIQGRFKNIWVHGQEIVEGLRKNELNLTSCKGYVYDAESDPAASPFRSFVDEFYKAKSTETDAILRHMHKITLNAPTGKFIQTSPDHVRVGSNIVTVAKAGGLYHPFIASSITAHCRARIHSLEHKVKAIHTATDGVFAPRNASMRSDNKGLGSIQLESRGDLVLLRGKLYILYGDEPAKGSYPSQWFKGKHVLKAARHGFQGTIYQLEEMIATGKRTYTVNKPKQLKEALRSGVDPNNFVTTERRLNVGPIKNIYGQKEETKRKRVKK